MGWVTGRKGEKNLILNHQILKVLTEISPDLRLWEVLPAKASEQDCNLTGPEPRTSSQEAWPKEKKSFQREKAQTWEMCSAMRTGELQFQSRALITSLFWTRVCFQQDSCSDFRPCSHLAALMAAAEPPQPRACSWKLSSYSDCLWDRIKVECTFWWPSYCYTGNTAIPGRRLRPSQLRNIRAASAHKTASLVSHRKMFKSA